MKDKIQIKYSEIKKQSEKEYKEVIITFPIYINEEFDIEQIAESVKQTIINDFTDE